MEKEAEDFYSRTVEFHPDYWFLDVEEKSMKDMRAGVSAYVKRLRELGVKNIGIYIGHHLYKSFNLIVKEVDAIWIPHYGRNTGRVDSKPAYPCDIHQYTSKGRLKGYDGYLDLNRIISDFSFDRSSNNIKQEKDTSYIVKPGDTLWAISRKYKVTIEDLVRWNNIKNRDLIIVGQVLKTGEPSKTSDGSIIHNIKWGDTLSGIALKYGVKMKDIDKINSIKDPNKIYAGRKLIIPK